MDDQDFKRRADEALQSLYKRLLAASDEAEFEADFNTGALAIEFENPPGNVTAGNPVAFDRTPLRSVCSSAVTGTTRMFCNGYNIASKLRSAIFLATASRSLSRFNIRSL